MAPVKAKFRPKNEATRSIRQDERATTNYVIHDSNKDSAERLRIQFLFSHLGMNGSRAALMSSLIWGATS